MKADVRVGPAGWSYEDWKGIVYPSPRPDGFHEASFLAQYFPIIEINTSFYRPLRPELARVWAKKLQSRPGFQFTAKLYRAFTHDRQLDRDDVRRFCEGLAPLADAGMLGCVLMQFPWSFRYSRENRDHLVRLQQAFGQYPLAAEMRHAGWNNPEALRLFEDHGIAFCNIDQPQLNQCLPPTDHVTSAIGYVRLHGRNYQEWFEFGDDEPRPGGLKPIEARYNYLYDLDQLRKWQHRIERIASQTRTTYVVTNNHFRGQAVVNALQIVSLVSGEPVKVPETLLQHYPELQTVAQDPPSQRSLFLIPPRRHAGQRQRGWAERRALPAVAVYHAAS
jgi:uncharacterized protein YecE (DUF72 family)